MDTTNNKSQTIKDLFSTASSIRIPPYQRAYSWEDKHCKQFLEDLAEQKGKSYYLGQFLFEKEGTTFYIVDGQQRLTTTVIFFSALVKILDGAGIPALGMRNLYLTGTFRTIIDDQDLFKRCTQKQLASLTDETETNSQLRIIQAFDFFVKALGAYDTDSLLLIGQTLEEAIISTFFINSKIEATQIFEYQNNRGKELSRFEVIKAYLMNQVYIHSGSLDAASSEIEDIQTIVSKTYRNIESVEGYYSEADLLSNYCYLVHSCEGNIDAIKEKLGKQTDKVTWIRNFFDGLIDMTSSAKTIVRNKHQPHISNLFFVGNQANWKIVMMVLYHNKQTQGIEYESIVKHLEILCFKLRLGDFRTDYLPAYAKEYFNGSICLEQLCNKVMMAAEYGFKDYWNTNNNFREIINRYIDDRGDHYSDKGVTKLILWQYENHLRVSNRSGALLDKERFDQYTIEHIKPQTPGGDEIYTEYFKGNFLHKAGNLALLTQSQNSRFGNKSFDKKRELFQDTALTSYTEIRDNTIWEEAQITARHKKIASFVKEYFNAANPPNK